jgi:hypothetical protein
MEYLMISFHFYFDTFLSDISEILAKRIWAVSNMGLGRAIAQAVSRLLPTAAVRVQTRVWSCGIL